MTSLRLGGASRAALTITLALAIGGATDCDLGEPPSDPGDPTERLPVLFVHGLYGELGGNSFSTMRGWLASNGWEGVELREMRMTDSTQCIERSAEEVADAVLALMADTGKTRIDIVGHSLGGLVARYYVKHLGGAYTVRNFVSITSPQHGTTFVGVNPWFCSINEMVPGSDFLNGLNAGDETPHPGVLYTSIRSLTDVFVQPTSSAHLVGAANVDTDRDHVQVLLQPDAFALVRAALEGAGANDD